ncbi:unnamed protein product [Prunus brigantina]
MYIVFIIMRTYFSVDHLPPTVWRRLWEMIQKGMSFSFSSALGTLQQSASRHSYNRPSAFCLRHPCIIRRVGCLHIPPVIRHPSIIWRVRCLHIPPMIRNRPSTSFHHSARAMSPHPPNDSESAFVILPSFGACDVSTSPQ